MLTAGRAPLDFLEAIPSLQFVYGGPGIEDFRGRLPAPPTQPCLAVPAKHPVSCAFTSLLVARYGSDDEIACLVRKTATGHYDQV